MDAKQPHSPTVLFENLVEFAPDALLVIDKTGKIILANSTAGSLFGFGRDELVGSPIERLVPERFKQMHTQHRDRYIDSPRTREMGATVTDLLATRKDGSEFPVEIRLSPVTVDGQSLVAAAVRDVTDRRHAAQVLKAAQLEADRANAAKSRFLATASHDLRQPLQTLQLLNAALQEQVADPHARELLTREREAMDAMARLLNALLDISKLEAGSIKPDIEDVSVAELFEFLRREFDTVAKARGLSLSVQSTPHYIKTDRTLFRQLLENLMANAIKYTEAGSIQLSCLFGADRFAITVADTGIGIAPEQLGSIFDEFYQVNRARRQGVGLGLAIVKRIASLLEMSIDVQSQVGAGTQFQVSVPASRVSDMCPIEIDASKTAVAHAKPALSAFILLVEDDDAVRAATEFYLKAVGHKSISAATIADAATALQSAHRLPDLIISDYHLGKGETGTDAIRHLRACARQNLPALLLSGDTSSAMQELAQIEACRILSKPVNVKELSSAIAELLA